MDVTLKQQIALFAKTQENPFFVYDLDKLSKHIASLHNQDIKLWYAVKANPLSKVISTLDKQGMNFDVASSGELDQVLAQGIDCERILNTGPAKSPKQVRHFLQRGVNTFVVESISQLALIDKLSAEFERHPSILLRVQLRFEEGDNNPLGGNALTPFGLGCDEWRRVDLSQYSNLSVIGLHIFQWGNMLDADKLISLWQAMVTPLTTLAEEMGFELQVLDLGGGLGIPYDQSQSRINWSILKAALVKIKQQSKVNELWLELGRFAVGEYGYYICDVIDVKHNYQQPLVVMQGGINHLLRPAITEQAFPVQLLRDSSAKHSKFHIHGPLCTSLDKLGHLALPDDLSEGDTLIFSQCGAYGFTEAMPYFLCHELPAEVVIEDSKFKIIRPSLPAASYLY
ncbi:MAG: PLP-dependent decarboxylase [Psychrobium sp.]|nr:PLP-dependent decarboxylase [Psychrobium sp.]